MALSRDCKEKLLQTMTGRATAISVAPTCFIGLWTSADGTELSGGGYKRMLIGSGQEQSSQIMGPADAAGKSTNVNTIFFPEAESDWGTVTHFALYASETTGEAHLWGALTSPVTISQGYVALFKPGTLSITLT